jgi:hypothetical protein
MAIFACAMLAILLQAKGVRWAVIAVSGLMASSPASRTG